MSILDNSLNLPCGRILRNRICKAAMTERLSGAHNFVNDQHIQLYRTWAKSGVGLLLSGNVQVDRRYLESVGNIAIEKGTYFEQLPKLKQWAETAKMNNVDFWMQISHAGRQTPAHIAKESLGPSNIQLKIPGLRYSRPKSMSEADITDVIDRFVFVASVAKEAGFTGIQIHAAHGYLLSEFLSPDINIRKDKWGGSIENRARLLLEIVRNCRSTLGSEFPISVKLNSADFQKGGFSVEDAIQVAHLLSNAGIDLLEISGGTYEQPRLLGLDEVGIHPKRIEKRRESTLAREAFFLDYAEAISKVIEIPLMVTGGFRSLTGMENAIFQNACQMIGIARPLCVNPWAYQELRAGKTNQMMSPEKTLSIGPGWLSIRSPFRLVQAFNALSTQAWFYRQIQRMSQNLMPNVNIHPFKAYWLDQKKEKKALKAFKKTWN